MKVTKTEKPNINLEIVGDPVIKNSFKEQQFTPKYSDGKETTDKYHYSVVSSAFQKYIRRGKESESLFFAYLFYKMGGVFLEKIITRILVICSEDVGIASLSILPFCIEQFQAYLENKTYGEDIFNKMTDCIIHLCRGKKDRNVDHAIYGHITRTFGLEYDNLIPEGKEEDETFLVECLKKEMEQGNEKKAIFYAGKLYNLGKFWDRSKEKSVFKAWKVIKEFYEKFIKEKDEDEAIKKNVDALYKLFDFFYLKDQSKHKPELLQLVHVIILLLNTKIIKENVKFEKLENLTKEERNDVQSKIKIVKPEDFVYDKHTVTGKEMKRGFDHFINEGIFLDKTITKWRKDIYFQKWKKLLLEDEKVQ